MEFFLLWKCKFCDITFYNMQALYSLWPLINLVECQIPINYLDFQHKLSFLFLLCLEEISFFSLSEERKDSWKSSSEERFLLQGRTSPWFCGVFRTIYQPLQDLGAQLLSKTLNLGKAMIKLLMALPLDRGVSTLGMRIQLKMWHSVHQGKICMIFVKCISRSALLSLSEFAILSFMFHVKHVILFMLSNYKPKSWHCDCLDVLKTIVYTPYLRWELVFPVLEVEGEILAYHGNWYAHVIGILRNLVKK